jgi:hypothetical protein
VIKNVYGILAGKTEEKKSFVRPLYRCKDDIERDLR